MTGTPTGTPSASATITRTPTRKRTATITGTPTASATIDLTATQTAVIAVRETQVAPYITPAALETAPPTPPEPPTFAETPVTGETGTPEITPPAPSPSPATETGTATVMETEPPTRAPVIVLDPGHGGPDTGAVAPDGLKEKDLNLAIALQLAPQLRAAGYTVLLTHDTDRALNADGKDINGDGTVDQDDELQARVDFANAAGATVFVSIHNNSDPRSTRSGGTTVYYCSAREFSAESARLAGILDAHLVGEIRAAGDSADRDNGARDDHELGKPEGHLYLLGPKNARIARPSLMPGSTGETLFLSNPADAAQLKRPEIIAAIARGYLLGLQEYLSPASTPTAGG